VIVLDTTILVYSVGSQHSLRNPCRELLELIRDGDVRATTTVQVVQEFAHVRAQRRPRREAATRAKEFARGLSPLVHPNDDDLLSGLELFEVMDTLGPFDAVLAATVARREWALASADRSFGDVPGIAHLNPSSSTFLDDARAVG